ncbi:MAG: aromatic ring-hydroxylating dioxygenase subunit alpha [Nevskia sp.]
MSPAPARPLAALNDPAYAEDYLRNAWYVAALSTEVGETNLFQRKLFGRSVLLYRRADGSVAALHNRCPHRFAPLHLGKRAGDEVICLYHGLRFDSRGACVHSPHGDGHIPSHARVRSFPCVDRHGFVWLWLGEAAAADEALIPDYGLLTRGHEHGVGYGYIQMPANYQLIVDNIMDLSHVDHLHGPLLSTAGKLSPLKPPVTEDERSVTIRWEWQQHPPIGLLAPFLPQPGEAAEQFVQVVWSAPSAMLLTVGAVQGSRDYEAGVISWDIHIMTPETETATHYFFGSRRNFLVEDAALNQAKLEGTLAAFMSEDRPLIAAVQQEMGTTDLWSLKPAALSCDTGGVRVRRKLAKMIEAERQRDGARG